MSLCVPYVNVDLYNGISEIHVPKVIIRQATFINEKGGI